jgi:hypothetical protein
MDKLKSHIYIFYKFPLSFFISIERVGNQFHSFSYTAKMNCVRGVGIFTSMVWFHNYLTICTEHLMGLPNAKDKQNECDLAVTILHSCRHTGGLREVPGIVVYFWLVAWS